MGDVVISSGLDRIFPKGLRIGAVESISKTESGIFQKVKVAPFVDFARLEEVLILVKDPDDEKEKAPEHDDAEKGQD